VPHVIYLEWPICLAVFLLTVVLGKEPAGSIVSNTEVPENNEFGDTLVEEA
jgi:SSS family solute:Na+ symporter